MLSVLIACLCIPLNDISPLPAEWHGTYQGTLHLQSPGKPSSEVPFELVIKPLDDAARVSWHIIYGEGDKRSVRPYELVAHPRKPGYFELDEKSGIKMQMHLVNHKLFCLFRVGQSLLHVQYELKPKEAAIHYEITSYIEKDPMKTAHEKNAKLEVESYLLVNVQSAVLKRQDSGTLKR